MEQSCIYSERMSEGTFDIPRIKVKRITAVSGYEWTSKSTKTRNYLITKPQENVARKRTYLQKEIIKSAVGTLTLYWPFFPSRPLQIPVILNARIYRRFKVDFGFLSLQLFCARQSDNATSADKVLSLLLEFFSLLLLSDGTNAGSNGIFFDCWTTFLLIKIIKSICNK